MNMRKRRQVISRTVIGAHHVLRLSNQKGSISRDFVLCNQMKVVHQDNIHFKRYVFYIMAQVARCQQSIRYFWTATATQWDANLYSARDECTIQVLLCLVIIWPGTWGLIPQIIHALLFKYLVRRLRLCSTRRDGVLNGKSWLRWKGSPSIESTYRLESPLGKLPLKTF